MIKSEDSDDNNIEEIVEDAEEESNVDEQQNE